MHLSNRWKMIENYKFNTQNTYKIQ